MSPPQASYEDALALQESGKLGEPRRLCAELLRLDPSHAKAHNNLGAILHREGDLEGAIASYERALQASPALFDAVRNLAIAWLERAELAKAERFARQALTLQPGSEQVRQLLAEILYNGALELEQAARTDEALARYREALELKSDFAEAALNAGALHSFKGNSTAAIAEFERALASRPDLALAHFDLGLERLLVGDYKGAWPEYEWRWKLPEFRAQRPASMRPEWDGSSPQGKTLLLYTEQGFGDAIQFLRYAPLLAQRGARVVVRCPPQLVRLFRHAPGVDQAVSDDDDPALPHFDACFPLLSLPLVFGTTRQSIPLEIPYVRAPQDTVLEWRGRVSGEGLRIGLVWGSFSGNKTLAQRKSLRLGELAGLGNVRAAARFYSLQKGPHQEEAAHPPPALPLIDLAPMLGDFSDTAAAIANLDLVITVDSAVAHLAGAMGKPVWTLAALPLDWRWAGDGRLRWYPSMRVFRQATHGAWDGVVREVLAALRTWR